MTKSFILFFFFIFGSVFAEDQCSELFSTLTPQQQAAEDTLKAILGNPSTNQDNRARNWAIAGLFFGAKKATETRRMVVDMIRGTGFINPEEATKNELLTDKKVHLGFPFSINEQPNYRIIVHYKFVPGIKVSNIKDSAVASSIELRLPTGKSIVITNRPVTMDGSANADGAVVGIGAQGTRVAIDIDDFNTRFGEEIEKLRNSSDKKSKIEVTTHPVVGDRWEWLNDELERIKGLSGEQTVEKVILNMMALMTYMNDDVGADMAKLLANINKFEFYPVIPEEALNQYRNFMETYLYSTTEQSRDLKNLQAIDDVPKFLKWVRFYNYGAYFRQMKYWTTNNVIWGTKRVARKIFFPAVVCLILAKAFVPQATMHNIANGFFQKFLPDSSAKDAAAVVARPFSRDEALNFEIDSLSLLDLQETPSDEKVEAATIETIKELAEKMKSDPSIEFLDPIAGVIDGEPVILDRFKDRKQNRLYLLPSDHHSQEYLIAHPQDMFAFSEGGPLKQFKVEVISLIERSENIEAKGARLFRALEESERSEAP